MLAGVVLLHAILAWLSRIPALSWGEDDAAYILLAQQLRHFGYRELQDIAAPIHARFPPGYPLIIALLGWPFHDSVDALLALNIGFTAATIVLLYLAARRHLGDAIALILAALFALNPTSLWDSGHIMAEAPFKCLMMLGLWALSEEDRGAKYSAIAGAAIIGAALTRSAGLVLLPALFTYWVLQRRYRHAALFAVASALTVGLWTGWALVAPDPEHRRLYVSDIGLAGPRRPRGAFLGDILGRIPSRVRRLATIVFPTALGLPVIRGTLVDNVAWLLLVTVLGASGTIVLWRRWRAAALLALFYGGLLVIWRYSDERFANPLVPLLLAAMLVGADWLARRYASRYRVALLAMLSALLMLGASRVVSVRLRDALGCDRAIPMDDQACWSPEYRAYLQAARWVRDSTPAAAIFFVNKERGFYMHSARRTINQDRVLQEDSLSLAPFLRSRGATHAVIAPVGTRSDRHNFLLAQACRDFVVLREFPMATVVVRLREATDPANDDGACRALLPYRALRPTRR